MEIAPPQGNIRGRSREDSISMQIIGKCHCENIGYTLDWPGDGAEIPVRVCGCSFCVKHGGAWTSHRDAALNVKVGDASAVSKYRFGTGTAEFYVCARCGAVPLVTSTIDDHLYAVVNVNAFENVDRGSLARAPADFDGEATGDRLERRKRNWIRNVTVTS
jgi:hypothetical protein